MSARICGFGCRVTEKMRRDGINEGHLARIHRVLEETGNWALTFEQVEARAELPKGSAYPILRDMQRRGEAVEWQIVRRDERRTGWTL